ncbi:MAG: PQQ-binding-like beta-propeller repeat protein [Thermomicrobiales bacterium]
MDRSSEPTKPSDSRPDEPQTTPLGGSARHASRSHTASGWLGQLATIRICPACGHQNESGLIFCADCGADLRAVELRGAPSREVGTSVMEARVRRDLRRAKRRPVEEHRGGSGWLLASPFLLLPGILLGNDSVLKYGVWLVGLACALYGLWSLRHDPGALRSWGITFGAIVAVLFGWLGNQAITAHDDATGPNAASPTADIASADVQQGSVAATPDTNHFSASAPLFRGDSALTGVQPGPAPAGSPKLAWRFDTGAELLSSPVLDRGTLYVASKGGDLLAIDAATGTLRWHTHLSDYVIRSSPSVADGTVYIGAGFSLFAIDANSGKIRWKAETRYVGQSTPTVADGIVVISSQEEWLYGFDAKTGAATWRIPTDGVVFGAPAIANGAVAFGTDKGTVYSMKLGSGEVLWRKTVGGGIVAPAAFANDRVIFSTDRGQTLALSTAKGDTLWTAEVSTLQPMAIANGVIVIAATDGGVHALNAADGTARWLYPTGERAIGAPTSVGDVTVVGAGSSLLSLTGTGTLQGYYLAQGTVTTSPVTADGYTFFGSEDGFLYAVTSGS